MSWTAGRCVSQASLGLVLTILTGLLCPSICSATFNGSLSLRPNNRIEYRIIKSFAAKRSDRFTVIIVVVDPSHFNRDSMRRLAEQLSADFSKIKKLKISLLDDERPARQLLKGGLEPDAYEKLQRGLYYVDRSRCVEYIRFTTPENRAVTINRKCSRK